MELTTALPVCAIQYTTASALLLKSVEEMKESSVELQTYAKRLEAVEARCRKLEAEAARKEEVARVESDARALYVSGSQ